MEMTQELVPLMLRGSLGLFFAFSGYHKLFNASRRQTLKDTFTADKVKPLSFFMWAIPLGEMFGGAAVLMGFLTAVASMGLIAICGGACALDGMKRIKEWKPLDAADAVDDMLYLPEFLYIVMLTVLIMVGAGTFSFDHLISGFIR
jgi:putative oxidoreductase